MAFTFTKNTAVGTLGCFPVLQGNIGALNLMLGPGYLQTTKDGGATFTSHTELPQASWFSYISGNIVVSFDGGGTPSYLYVSSNGGDTFVEVTSLGVKSWQARVSGTNIVAVVQGAATDYVYTSQDGGDNFTARLTDEMSWNAAISGNIVLAYSSYTPTNYLYLSTDGGATFTVQTPLGAWAWSADVSGNTIMAVAQDSTDSNKGYIWTSSDGGSTFIKHTELGKHYWAYPAVYGTTLFAADNSGSGYLYLSTDGGDTFVAQTALGSHSWYQFAASGNTLVAVTLTDNLVFTSSDGGTNFIPHSELSSSLSWYGLVSGSNLALFGADGNNGGLGPLYTSTDAGVTFVDSALGDYYWSFTLSGSKIIANAIDVNTFMGDLWIGNAAAPSIPTTVDGEYIVSDIDDGLEDGKITLTQDMTVEATGDLTLNVNEMGKLDGGKIITIKPHGKIHLAGGRTVTVLDGTKGKVHT